MQCEVCEMDHNITTKKTLYEQAAVWDAAIQVGQRGLLQAIIDFWPTDAKSAADIGCGDGKITEAISKAIPIDIVGLDKSNEALSRVSIKKVQGDILNLPEQVKQRDLTLCLDVLEHLEQEEEAAALNGLFEAAGKYLFIAVPYNEQLLDGLGQCQNCNFHYHVNWHQRSYLFEDFKDRIPSSWKLDHVVLCGENWGKTSSIFKDYKQQVFSEYAFWEHMICPKCNHTNTIDTRGKSEIQLTTKGVIAQQTEKKRHESALVTDSNTELLMCFSRKDIKTHYPAIQTISTQSVTVQDIDFTTGTAGDDKQNLSEFPSTVKIISLSEETVVQLPYMDSKKIRLSLEDVPGELTVLVEDVFGSIPLIETGRKADELELSCVRKPFVGIYGVIIRISCNISTLRNMDIYSKVNERLYRKAIIPAPHKYGYYTTTEDLYSWNVQVRTNSIIGEDQLPRKQLLPEPDSFCWQKFVQGVVDLRKAFRKEKEAVDRLHNDIYQKQVAKDLIIHQAGGWFGDCGQHILMMCHDQNIDRRIISQAKTLTAQGHIVTIIGLSYTAEDEQTYIENGICVVKVGLTRIKPENWIVKRYARWQNRLNRVIYSRASRFRKPFSTLLLLFYWGANKTNYFLYRFFLLCYFNNFKLHDPLQYRSAFLEVAEKYKANVIQAHDLPALQAAAELAKKWNVLLVYDAHELYPEQAVFSKKQRQICSDNESEFINNANLVFTVNDSIAEEMVKRYNIKRPVTILNALNSLEEDDGTDYEYMDILRKKTKLSTEKKILLFQGGMSPHRNLRMLVAAMAKVKNSDICLILMGPGDYRKKLEQDAKKLAVLNKRVFFLDAVSQKELLQHSAAADVGIIPYPHIDLNSYYCTPNKLFEFIQAGLPMLANDSPELRRFIYDNGFGMVHQMESASQLAQAIDSVFEQDLNQWKTNILANRENYSWSVEGKKYYEAFLSILNYS